MTPTQHNTNTLHVLVATANAGASIAWGISRIYASKAPDAASQYTKRRFLNFLGLQHSSTRDFVTISAQPLERRPTDAEANTIIVADVPVDRNQLLKGLFDLSLGVAGIYYVVQNFRKN